MPEDLGELLSNGFKTWNSNVNTAIPFLLNTLVSIMVILIAIVTALFPVARDLLPVIESATEIPGQPRLSPEQLLPVIIKHFDEILITAAIFSIVILLVRAFFLSGAIGMAKEATDNGATIIGDMIDYGKRNIFTLFPAKFLISSMMFAPIFVLLSGLVTTVNGFMVVTLAMLPYMITIFVIFQLVDYAIVLDGLGTLDGIKTGMEVFLKNKTDVLLLVVVVLAISLILNLSTSIHPILTFVGLVVSLLVIRPLTVVWWTRFYQDRRDRLTKG
ncbi:MAG: hypothetical protein SVJ22_09870 [Halobacteriota archaeon]|nr:hypothetical protein [Halobacteriota archaeon]